jgi:hypothetical protein
LEHIKIQRDNAKASYYYDDIKVGDYEDKLMKDMVIKEAFSPDTKELMTRYLTGEIRNRQMDEMKIEQARRDRVNLELDPEFKLPSVTPPKLVTDYVTEYTRKDEEARRNELLRSGLEKLNRIGKGMRTGETLKEIFSSSLRKQREGDITSELGKLKNRELKPMTDLKGKPSQNTLIQNILERARKGKGIDVDPELSQKRYQANIGRLNGDDGDGLLGALKANLQ